MKIKMTVFLLGCLALAACSHQEIKHYQSDEYKLSLTVPAEMTLQDRFKKGYLLTDQWRFDDGNPNRGPGRALLQVTAADFKTDAFPRYFSATLRIGVSQAAKAISNCYKAGPLGKLKPVTIQGVEYDVFPIEDVAMNHVVEGKSYRTVRNGTCYAIEIVKAYSNYRDAKSPKDMTDSELNRYIEALDQLFTRIKLQ